MIDTVFTSTKLQSIFDDRKQTLRLIWDAEYRARAEEEREKLLLASNNQGSGRQFADFARRGANVFAVLEEFPEFPNEPDFFSRQLPESTLAQLLNIEFTIQLVKSDGAGCSVNQIEAFDYEIQHPDRPLNVGLARMIAHEAGHVRFDSRFQTKDKIGLIQSEVAALRSERKFLDEVLSACEMKTYLEYQKAWLKINRFAARCEVIEIGVGHSRGRPKKLWALEWASSRVGFSEVLVRATEIAFPELKGSKSCNKS
jgi:hypothetical protein